ncbi:hypothetical protein FACS1894204_06230 [Synergistales bacterium]|nr:hypothetical protein FACS1894204_06230 [Synergistales bacterium]
MEKQQEEALYRLQAQGERARVVLEALEQWFNDKQKNLVSALYDAKNPEEAFLLSCQYRVLCDLMGEMRAAVTFGKNAAKEFKENEKE